MVAGLLLVPSIDKTVMMERESNIPIFTDFSFNTKNIKVCGRMLGLLDRKHDNKQILLDTY